MIRFLFGKPLKLMEEDEIGGGSWDDNGIKYNDGSRPTQNDYLNKFLSYCDVPTKMHLQLLEDKKGLEEYRELRTKIEVALEEGESWERDYFELKRAIEILKDKNVNIWMLCQSKTLKAYNKLINIEENKLTQEEFDFLKEVL